MYKEVFKKWATFNELELALHSVFLLWLVVILGWLIYSIPLPHTFEGSAIDQISLVILTFTFIGFMVRGALLAIKLPFQSKSDVEKYPEFDVKNLKFFVGFYFGCGAGYLTLFALNYVENEFFPVIVKVLAVLYFLIVFSKFFFLYMISRADLTIFVTSVKISRKLLAWILVLFGIGTGVIIGLIESTSLFFLIIFSFIGLISLVIPDGDEIKL